MSGHTKGPWQFTKVTNRKFDVMTSDCQLITRLIAPKVQGTNCSYIAEYMSNAYLIAAAPDLLEALQNMLAAFDNPILRRKLQSSFNDEAISSARAAIDKARGAK